MIETFIYISNEISELKVYAVDISSKERSQSEIYRKINSSNQAPSYYISENTIYFLSEEKDLGNSMELFKEFNITQPKHLNMDFLKHPLISRRLIRETLIRNINSHGKFIKREKNRILIKVDEDKDQKFERFISASFSYQIIDKSLLLLFDVVHIHPDNYDHSEFKKYSMLNPYDRYTIIQKNLRELFNNSNIDIINIKIPDNNPLSFRRIKQ
jgi:hypothetical protein